MAEPGARGSVSDRAHHIGQDTGGHPSGEKWKARRNGQPMGAGGGVQEGGGPVMGIMAAARSDEIFCPF
ncbi:hypothetical protein HVIM_04550 (plasmid) [Roseomonas mucosa]|nr:hypothetical protein HVIM_04550 [Roseomonas mucosa]QDD98005.1 hypothetical protein ADP8_04550 [Roseomonas mucosa]